LIQKLLKINSVNPIKYSTFQHLYQYLLWLNEYLQLNSIVKHGLA